MTNRLGLCIQLTICGQLILQPHRSQLDEAIVEDHSASSTLPEIPIPDLKLDFSDIIGLSSAEWVPPAPNFFVVEGTNGMNEPQRRKGSETRVERAKADREKWEAQGRAESYDG